MAVVAYIDIVWVECGRDRGILGSLEDLPDELS